MAGPSTLDVQNVTTISSSTNPFGWCGRTMPTISTSLDLLFVRYVSTEHHSHLWREKRDGVGFSRPGPAVRSRIVFCVFVYSCMRFIPPWPPIDFSGLCVASFTNLSLIFYLKGRAFQLSSPPIIDHHLLCRATFALCYPQPPKSLYRH